MPPAPGRASAWQACGPSQNVLSGSCSLACGDTFIVLTIIVYPMSGSPRFADRQGGGGGPAAPGPRRLPPLGVPLVLLVWVQARASMGGTRSAPALSDGLAGRALL